MKVLVTGATGFIGTTLCGILAESGFQIRALLRPGAQLHASQTHPIEVVEGDEDDSGRPRRVAHEGGTPTGADAAGGPHAAGAAGSNHARAARPGSS